MHKHVIEKFRNGDAVLGVIGLGYVGLPLAVQAARSGLRVVGFDVNAGVVEGVSAGRSHIQDVKDDEVARLRSACRLQATMEMARLAECDAISICVPTPLSKTRDPDISYILAATDSVAAALRSGQLVVLESTTYPGTTREVLLPKLGDKGLTAGEDFFLCFSPERVDPGNEVWKVHNTPKVIGGITPRCTQVGRALYERFIETVVSVSSCEAAELTKLLGNTFRAVNIGLVNEMAQISERLGVDVWEVIEGAATKPFGFMKFSPGPGLGGHCIPIDPQYLSWKMRTLNYKTRFIELASEINAEMPRFVADKIREALNRKRKPVNGSRILVLGVAYKRDTNDVRESPAVDIMQLLLKDGAEVIYHDPYVPEFSEDGMRWKSTELTDAALRSADAAVIVTDHTAFDYRRIFEFSGILVDARNATARALGRERLPHPTSWIVKDGEPAG
ncbi:MAG: nucleotide sugar dehydrogenase [Gemmatimonadetes bacterium]|nr:nucleotide sugar dehydrogenase [Gemmatimonadota bacterium]